MRGIKVLALIVIGLITLIGCSRQVIDKEVRQYSTQANKEGNDQLRFAGKAINGALVGELVDAFKAEGIVLTNGRYIEENNQSMTYRYQIEQNHDLSIEVRIFNSEQQQVETMNELYKAPGVTETQTTLNVVYSKNKTALVYRSSGQSKGKYYEKASRLLPRILERVE